MRFNVTGQMNVAEAARIFFLPLYARQKIASLRKAMDKNGVRDRRNLFPFLFFPFLHHFVCFAPPFNPSSTVGAQLSSIRWKDKILYIYSDIFN